MQLKFKLFLVVVQVLLASCAQSKVTLFKKGEVVPIVFAETAIKRPVGDFISLFNKFGTFITVNHSRPTTKVPAIQLAINNKIEGFTLVQNEKLLSISGKDEEALIKGIRYFFTTYTNLNQFTAERTRVDQEVITIPVNLNYQSNTALTYIEPYFHENFDPEFRLWNNTNTLDESWGLWGHNIGKVIKVTPEMLAVIDGRLNDEQLNFSSEALETALVEMIKEKLLDNPKANKFMIMPFDNDLVCVCAACLKAGNTKTNASPAVFKLLNKLAERFPKSSFFSTAYITTETPPRAKLKPNAGVMISTMSFPKGVVISNTNKAQEIGDKFKSWQQVTNNIYLWDYAINFDNYFDFYPTVSITQKNLIFYLQHGVKGIFMHGSDEGSFAAFGDLKAYLYAQLFNQPNIDIDVETAKFLTNRYPILNNTLKVYYQKIERSALNSTKTINIYGGVKQAVDKYLNSYDITNTLSAILTSKLQQNSAEQKASELLTIAFLFQNLEVARVNGFGDDGYGTYSDGKFIVKPHIITWLTILKTLAAKNKVDRYNESNFTLSQYFKEWNSRILTAPYQNLFFEHSFRVTSQLDEDYNNATVLNDGAIGLSDYYNNWLVNSSATFEMETNVTALAGASILQIDFLHSKRHKIFPPQKVTATVGTRVYAWEINTADLQDNQNFVRVVLPLKIKPSDATLKIVITKQPKKRQMAFDEIILK